MERARTGIKGLDEALEGGLPRPSSVLVAGSIGSKKNTFAQRILYEGLLEGEKGIYVTVDLFPEDIVENMEKYGMSARRFIEEGRLVFIDCFSPRVGVESSARYLVENPFDLDEVLREIVVAKREFLEPGDRYRLVISHLSTLFFSASKELIPGFIGRLHAEARRSRGIHVMVYSEGVLNKHYECFLKSLPDVVFELSRRGSSRYLRILRCIKTSYPLTPFRLSHDMSAATPVEGEER
ncbi:RAD55 family ATPase [Thermofilum pendens]|uniref:Circadian clock protein, KaiC n=1 Tax=Thermofilum pendens (strain DSM 2475 / Hrk 5) TaxID=368408 RepID=A1S0H8_THEPD|nr:RAD55 family ATPase [Thermofilum pendens]ABL78958.1 putative circadian clock protein, KaiC [Thermofilum pendens Hrk 5]